MGIELNNMKPAELRKFVEGVDNKFMPTEFQIDWGPRQRGQGRRAGGMVMGAMSGAPTGIKTYTNRLGNLPKEQADAVCKTSLRDSHHGLDMCLRALSAGFNVNQAIVIGLAADNETTWNNSLKRVKFYP